MWQRAVVVPGVEILSLLGPFLREEEPTSALDDLCAYIKVKRVEGIISSASFLIITLKSYGKEWKK